MKKYFVFLVVLLFSLSTFAENFLIYSGDAILGQEEVVFSDNKVITKTNLNVLGQKLSFEQTLIFKNNRPESYYSNLNNQVNISGNITKDSAIYTVANQSRTFRGKGLYPLENNTFYLWSYVFLDAPEQIVVPSQLLALKVNYSKWVNGPFGTQIRQINIGQLGVIGYFFENKFIRLSIPLQNIDYIHEDWLSVFRDEQTDQVKTEAITLKRGNDLLAGELNLPDNKESFPVILLLSGSGPQVRDNNSPPEMTNSIFKHLSTKLTSSGYGVLRFDDRGMGKSSGDHMKQDFETLVEDAALAVELLQKRPDVSQIGILGHSEGGIIALKLAADNDIIDFCILLATPSTSLDQILKEQLKAQMDLEYLSSQEKKYLEELLVLVENSLDLAKKGADLTPLGFTGAYLRQHMQTDPLKYAELVTCPLLILQGEADIKVLPHHAYSLKSAATKSSSVEVITYPYLTHYFTPSPLDNPAFDLNQAFKTPDKIYDDIVNWLIVLETRE